MFMMLNRYAYWLLFYVYDNEGQLIRKLIETERGTKVITETQYNLPRELRD